MDIKILSLTTINKISAGEVIERPLSVVKELVENSIDASATKIEISLERSGKNLIIVKDNGSGISEENLEIAIQRHTTSKLDEKDLLDIRTLGFRGEALPSIAAISKFKITSKKRDSMIAYTLSIYGGIKKRIEKANLSEGTRVEVRDLFFATPARLKFLRSDKNELIAIITLVKKFALSYPNISFLLIHEGKEVLKLRKNSGNFKEILSIRVTEIMGKQFLINSLWINFKSNDLLIYGYISVPTYNKAFTGEQFFFVNNRPIRDNILNIALKLGYQGLLPKNRYPISALFIKLDPHFIDVNVHPTKTEVRFHNPNLVKSILSSNIKKTLKLEKYKTSSNLGKLAIDCMINPNPLETTSCANSNYERERFPEKNIYSDKKNEKEKINLSINHIDYEETPITETVEQTNLMSSCITDSKCYLGKAKTQVFNTYIISQTKDSIIIADQHAAHERIGYEKIKEEMNQKGIKTQRLLIPEIIEFLSIEKAQILANNKANLAELGLSLKISGIKTIVVYQIPSILVNTNIVKLIDDLSDCLLALDENVMLTELVQSIIGTYACHYSIRAGRILSILEMNELLRQMESTPFSAQCNHGRPTYFELKLKDIEKLFGRRK